MFPALRYVTSTVADEIPLLLQLFLWQCVDRLPEPDYLQVFELSYDDSSRCQHIVHTQEVPLYRKEYILPSAHPITARIYAINDETHATMLFANEY